MFKISEGAMGQFREFETDKFVKDLVEHLREHFQERCEELEASEELEAFVRRELSHAESYKIDTELGVCYFTDVALILGDGFDASADLPWVSEILTDPEFDDATDRAEALFEATIDWLRFHR